LRSVGKVIAHQYGIPGRKVVVNAQAKLIAITVQILGGGIKVRSRVRHGVKAEQVLGNGTDRGEDVTRILLSGVFVDQGIHLAGVRVNGLRKVSLPLQRGRYGGRKCLALNVAKAFVIGKKEGFFALNGPPCVAPN
jgi:hypothetical protein